MKPWINGYDLLAVAAVLMVFGYGVGKALEWVFSHISIGWLS